MVYAMIVEAVYELCELGCEPLSQWLTISILLEPSDVADICKYLVPDIMETFFSHVLL
jgi:hypothetical protein